MSVPIALVQDDLGGLAQLVLVVVFLLVSGLAKLFKRSQGQQTIRREPRPYVPPSEPATRELTWEDLLRGRLESPPVEPEPAQTIEGHSARDSELAPRGVLSEVPTEAELETQGGDVARPMVEGAAFDSPIAGRPADVVIAASEIAAGARPAVTSERTRMERSRTTVRAWPSGFADWRRAIVAREVLGPPVALRALERDLVG